MVSVFPSHRMMHVDHVSATMVSPHIRTVVPSLHTAMVFVWWSQISGLFLCLVRLNAFSCCCVHDRVLHVHQGKSCPFCPSWSHTHSLSLPSVHLFLPSRKPTCLRLHLGCAIFRLMFPSCVICGRLSSRQKFNVEKHLRVALCHSRTDRACVLF